MKWGAYYRQSDKTVRYRIGSRRKASVGWHTKKQWLKLCELCGNRCLKCGREGKLSPDHIIPASRGGTTWITNIAPLCPRCNMRKSNIYVFDYRPEHVKQWARDELAKMGVNVDDNQ